MVDLIDSLIPEDSPAAPELRAADARHRRGMSIQVLGRAGTGRDTMARALRSRLGVSAIGPGEDDAAAADADLWLYLLGGLPRPADFRALRPARNAPRATTPPVDRTIVVLGKADTHGDWETATEVANRAAARLARPVLCVSQLLACADITPDDLAFLHELDRRGEHMPSMAGQFLAGVQVGSDEYRNRMGLLRRLDQFGIDTALELCATGHPAAASVASLNAAMRGISGIDTVGSAISARAEVVGHWRTVELRGRLERLAAEGTDRDTVEHILRTVVAS